MEISFQTVFADHVDPEKKIFIQQRRLEFGKFLIGEIKKGKEKDEEGRNASAVDGCRKKDR